MENETSTAPTSRSLVSRVRRKIKHTYGKSVVATYRKVVAQAPIMRLKNARSRHSYRSGVQELRDVGKRVLSDLNRDGLSIIHLEDIFPNQKILPELQSFVEKEFVHASLGRNKKFLTFLWDNFPVFSLSNPLIKLALRPEIIEIVNAYMDLYSRFAFFSVNRTVVAASADAQGSQRWHRDPALGDERMVKVFLYLNDVLDTGTGPFMYIKGSQRTGKWGKVFPARQPDGLYPPEGAVEKSELAAGITPCLGRAGTLVFCDTTGLHKGGFSMTKERIMSTFYYVSPGSLQKPNFSFPPEAEKDIFSLSPLSRRTIGR